MQVKCSAIVPRRRYTRSGVGDGQVSDDVEGLGLSLTTQINARRPESIAYAPPCRGIASKKS
jgi:hypothetical protein